MSALESAFSLLPGLEKAGKVMEALNAIGVLAPTLLGGPLTVQDVISLHASRRLSAAADAIATIIKDVDAVLTADPSQAENVKTLLMAIGLKA